MTKCKDCIYYVRMKSLPNFCNNPQADKYGEYIFKEHKCEKGISIKELEKE